MESTLRRLTLHAFRAYSTRTLLRLQVHVSPIVLDQIDVHWLWREHA